VLKAKFDPVCVAIIVVVVKIVAAGVGKKAKFDPFCIIIIIIIETLLVLARQACFSRR
jgi:hypothetical protein